MSPRPRDLADLAQSLVPVAARLVGAVHFDGAGAVARVLAQVPPAHLPGLSVVLAAMIDPERSTREMLDWVDWDEGEPRYIPDTLFSTMSATTPPEEMTDEQLRYGHGRWRMRERGTLHDGATIAQDRAAYLEWERRRHAPRPSPDPSRPPLT